MGNLSYIIPTENQEEFNREKITEILENQFPDLIIHSDDEWDQIVVSVKPNKRFKDELVVQMYFNADCYLLKGENFENSISELRDKTETWPGGEKLAEQLSELKELNPDLNKSISMTHCPYYDLREVKRQVEIYLHSYFKSFIFDEGIHPEFIPPDYVWRPVRKQKRFLGFKI